MRLSVISTPLLVAIIAASAACASAAKAPEVTQQPVPSQIAGTAVTTPLKQTVVTYPGGQIRVEVADTEATRAKGLGERDSLAQDAGMLFDLGGAETTAFWMKGMRFPLDMVWIGEDKRVVAVTADIPPQPGVPDSDLKTYSPGQPVRYVLELNSGIAAQRGIAPGLQLTFSIP